MIDSAFHPLFPLDMRPMHYFSVLGRALFTAQHLEMNCRAIAALLHMSEQIKLQGSLMLEDPAFQRGMSQLWRKTLGQHVRNLTEEKPLPGDAIPILKAAVKARNNIAHSVAMDVTDRLEAELEDRLDQLTELVRKIAEADKIAAAIVHGFNNDPLPTGAFFQSYTQRVVAWVMEDAYGD